MIHNDIIEPHYPIPDEKKFHCRLLLIPVQNCSKNLDHHPNFMMGVKVEQIKKSKLLSDPLENWIGETSKDSKILIDR